MANTACGKHEKEILANWKNDGFDNSIAIGSGAMRAISHLKVLISRWRLYGQRSHKLKHQGRGAAGQRAYAYPQYGYIP
jgi:hypothetical protein